MYILVPDNLHKAGLALLNETEGLTVNAPGKMSRDDVKAVIAEADAMIVRSGTKADAELLSLAPKLKVIVRAGVGVDNIDLEAATAQNIVVMNAPQGNTVATAEHTLALMLALARHIPQAQQSMLEGRWDRKQYMGTELRGKVLGLVGFGRVGRAVAQRAKAFEMMVVAHDPFVSAEIAAEHFVELVTLDDLLTRADYISLHAVVTDSTREFINADNIAKMKDGVRIINAARGALIHDKDLAAAISSGKVAGAALDVYVKEPPEEEHPLIGLPGVIDTPHLGASTVEAQVAVALEAAEKVLDALQNQHYRDVVNPAVLEK